MYSYTIRTKADMHCKISNKVAILQNGITMREVKLLNKGEKFTRASIERAPRLKSALSE